jgi:hypothetical protein
MEVADLLEHFEQYWLQCETLEDAEEARQQLITKIVDRVFVYDDKAVAIALHGDFSVILDNGEVAPMQVLEEVEKTIKRCRFGFSRLHPERERQGSIPHLPLLDRLQNRLPFSGPVLARKHACCQTRPRQAAQIRCSEYYSQYRICANRKSGLNMNEMSLSSTLNILIVDLLAWRHGWQNGLSAFLNILRSACYSKSLGAFESLHTQPVLPNRCHVQSRG